MRNCFASLQLKVIFLPESKTLENRKQQIFMETSRSYSHLLFTPSFLVSKKITNNIT